jgi:hypothetical protein
MLEPIYTYTFTFESSGFATSSPFKLPVGTIFNYWGYTWEVTECYLDDEGNESNDFKCTQV